MLTVSIVAMFTLIERRTQEARLCDSKKQYQETLRYD